jgi:hypothetical protein
MNTIKIQLTKDESGITASNEEQGTIEFFDKTPEARKEFIYYMLENFINQEVK